MSYVMMGAVSSTSVKEAQAFLKREGFDPGPIDGIIGKQTRAAQANYTNVKGQSAAAGVAESFRTKTDAASQTLYAALVKFQTGNGAELVKNGQIPRYQEVLRNHAKTAKDLMPSITSNFVYVALQKFLTYPAFDASSGGGGRVSTTSVDQGVVDVSAPAPQGHPGALVPILLVGGGLVGLAIFGAFK